MGIVVPAIIPSSQEDLAEKLERLAGLADFVQIDVVDGRFANPPSWPYTESGSAAAFAQDAHDGETLPRWGEFKFDIDFMVEDPGKVLESWIAEGASRLTIHLESTRDLPRVLESLKVQYGYGKDFAEDLLSIGLAVNVATDPSVLEPFVSRIDYVQFMGIARIGKQGEPFDERVIERVRAFRKAHPDIAIQVDGGVSLTTAPALLDAGVNRIVVGSALWKAPDIRTEYEKFVALTERYGLYE